MSALAIAHPAVPRRRLHPVPALPEPPVAVRPEPPVTVTISISGTGAGRDRVVAALRDFVDAAGQGVSLAEPEGAGGLRLDPGARTAFRDGQPLDLSRLEYDLLLFLARHPRQVFSRSQLLAQVWGHTHTTNRTVDVHVSRLRTKLSDPEVVTTVYGLGYRLADEAAVTVVER
ncbi:winged helix-turn-helix domain-containing protein [Actinoplanes sp. M2I2]|uniref:winged helix-turn-helix domain-containing protein n=1 Tax=Actinoplanes sp. M2I2 TaxID=1734444 RepID=UPI0020211F53|nr:winged helix-turn-helix domain-containing protein [Actinoplanes sp. M2I2]